MQEKKKQSHRKNIGRWGVFVLLTLALGWSWMACQGETSTEYTGLSAEAKVVRDEHGIPHIYAKDRFDAYYIGGYEVARDRLFQMDLLRRRASGRLSEIFGAKYKRPHDAATFDYRAQDLLIRQYGLRYWAEQSLPILKEQDPEIYKTLAAYAMGVNAFLRDAKAGKDGLSLPYGFGKGEMDYEPEEWSVVDSLAIGKMQAFGLSDTSLFEIIFTFGDILMPGETKFDDIFRIEPPDKTFILDGFPGQTKQPLVTDGVSPQPSLLPTPRPAPSIKLHTRKERIMQLLDSMRQRDQMMPSKGGSNNWVISGKHTKNGKPILANDPHLPLSNPPIFYAIHYEAQDGYQAAGFAFPGIPYILIGHNDKIAWGTTTARADVTDLYANNVKQEGDQLTVDGEGLTVKIREEKIRVRKEDRSGFDEETLRVEYTEKGTLFKEIPPLPSVELFGSNRLRIHWAGMAPTIEAKAFYLINTSKNLADFRKAMSFYQVGAQNLVCITSDNEIGYSANALQPIREKLDPAKPPWRVMPGKGYDFTGRFVEESLMPHLFNPERGFIITANNDPVGTTADNNPLNDPYYLAFVYDSGFRARRLRERIEEDIAADKKWDLDETQKLIFDTYSHIAKRILPRLDAAWEAAQKADEANHPRLVEMAKDTDLAQAVAHLKAWDKLATLENTGAPLFYLWMAYTARRWIRDDMPGELFDQIIKAHPDGLVRPLVYFLEGGKTAAGSDLADNKATRDIVETGDEIALLALQDAIQHLKRVFPNKPFNQVEWGEMHLIQIRNDFGEKLLLPEKGRQGSMATVDVSHFDFVGTGKPVDDRFQSYHAAVIRFLAEFTTDNRPKARFALFGGQSGNPDSPHFGAFLDDWRTGKLRDLPFTKDEVDAVKRTENTFPSGSK